MARVFTPSHNVFKNILYPNVYYSISLLKSVSSQNNVHNSQMLEYHHSGIRSARLISCQGKLYTIKANLHTKCGIDPLWYKLMGRKQDKNVIQIVNFCLKHSCTSFDKNTYFIQKRTYHVAFNWRKILRCQMVLGLAIKTWLGFWRKKHGYLSHSTTKPTKWHGRPAKTQISLGICPVWSEFAVHMKKVHPPSLIRVFAVHMKKAWVLPGGSLATQKRAQRRLWSDWADAAHFYFGADSLL